ncbi:MAG TPA: serine hydrolase domain-containing protein [Patescibacteria group bacterium]|nr:serine hydrolase domain-containing protein [Patescibacteria group bacterium]
MPSLTPTQKAAFTAVEHWLNHKIRFAGLPGIQLAVRQEGELLYSRAFGFANEEAGEKYTTSHAGHLASQSKMFAGCLTLQLMQAGALSLHDLAATHLPWLKKHKDKRFQEIALRDLLTHRAGLFRDGLDGSFWELEKPFLSREQLKAEILAARLVFDPNTETKYSNVGLALLGLALEAATGESYADLVQKHILAKLKGALLMPDRGLRANTKYASGYSGRIYDGKHLPLRMEPANALAPAAGVCGTAEGASQFLHAYLFTDAFLPVALRREVAHLNWKVKNVPTESYGLGMLFSGIKEDVYIGHGGGYPGFTSQTRVLKDSRLVLSAVINTNEFNPFNAVRTTADLLRKVETTFPGEKKLEVTEPMMNKWGATLYVIGAKQALVLPLDGWTPAEEAYLLDRQKDGSWNTDKTGGFTNVGEPTEFIRKAGKVMMVKSSAQTTYPPDEFLRRSRKTIV